MSYKVAPPAGAWIETPEKAMPRQLYLVAPSAGAWIETSLLRSTAPVSRCRVPCGRVD